MLFCGGFLVRTFSLYTGFAYSTANRKETLGTGMHFCWYPTISQALNAKQKDV